jgi:tetratricopeptide (TPR) repeat protein
MRNHELTRIRRIYYIFGMVLLFSGLGSYAFGCCQMICPPCQMPNMSCTACQPPFGIPCPGGCCPFGTTCCGSGCCPSGTTCCGGTTCCLSSETCCGDHCCTAGYTCCASGCCDPSQCQTCVGGQCKVCGGDPDKACCNGSCYDIHTQQCCTDISPSYICDISKVCCNGECKSNTCTLGMSETETLLKLGWSNFSQGDWQEATSYFERGLAKLPNENKPTNILYGLARIYENTGNIQKAEESYLQLISLMKDETSQIQEVKSHITSLDEKTGQ